MYKLFKCIHKKMTNPKNNEKFYGKPYPRLDQLRRGDRKLIQQATGLAYVSIMQQLEGRRRISPAVKAMADRLADNNQRLLEAIDEIGKVKKN